MQFEDLKAFIKKEDGRLREQYGPTLDQEKRALARTVKLVEEVGELCSEVLARQTLQRQEKLERSAGSNMANEFADVIITVLLLAETMGVNIEEALARKIETINRRYV